MRIATAVNGVFSYLATDGLGSADITVDSSGNVLASTLYAPYGGVRYTVGTPATDYGFTGQHADTITGLDYYGARYYDPVAGQFVSADTVVPGGGFDVWGLSRYAYVEGNPVARTDPSGNVMAYAGAGGGCYPCGNSPGPATAPVVAWNPFTWHWKAAGKALKQGTSQYQGASAYQVAQAVAGDIDLYTFGSLGRLDHAMGGHLAESEYYKQGQEIGTPFAVANLFLGGYSVARGGYALYRGLSAAPELEQVAAHGNSLASLRLTTLYRLNDSEGNILKWGITSAKNPLTRYSQAFMADKRMMQVATGTRAEMAGMERVLTERVPGPSNLEPWAGTQYGNDMAVLETILGGGG
jgi:RHS repeat-associated protein